MQIIAVSLIGIPGSGKSTTALKILDLSMRNQLEAGVIIISFDDFVCPDLSELSKGVYKQSREDLMENVQEFMMKLKTKDIESVLKSHRLKISEKNYYLKDNSPILVLLDDNMYFRSMRQKVRAVCRKINCDYFQIFIKSSIEDAIERNKKRKNPVPDEIIEKMFNNLEVPTNPRTIFIESTESDENFLKFLKNRIENPEKLEAPECLPKIPQHQSIIHEADLITRKELTTRIKNLPPGSDISQLSARFNRQRKKFLENLKSEKVEFTDVESLKFAFNCYLDE